jgi:hypothetical protein
LFGTKAVLLDSAIDERGVLGLAAIRGQRKDNGGFYIDGLHEMPEMAKLLELTRWSLMPVAPDRSHGLFVASPENAAWVEKLREWCERSGRSHCRVAMEGDKLALVDISAAAEARERAAASHIDQFLGKMDRYFRLGDESLLPRIRQRLEAARRMREEIAQAKKDKQA